VTTAVEVLSAIRAVAAGEVVGPPRISAALFPGAAQQLAIRQNPQVRSEIGLSPSEQQLVELIRRGLTNKEIASRLNPSEHTVKNHVHPHPTQNRDIAIESRSWNPATGELAHPSPQPTHCIVKPCLAAEPR
jgi:DNA-binding CsgD family transcriptional regulator